jgi:ArsR family transcriptional regulator, arsenate/arsenite/antimonite-responsive transcriptional repressor
VSDPPSAAEAVLPVVADPLRLRILELLAVEQLCVCHLQEALAAKQALVSHHLRALREAGLVETEACGRFTYYRLRPGAFDAVRDALADLAAASRATLPRRPC